VHLAIIRAFNIDSTPLDRERVGAFPHWQDYLLDFEFTPIHRAVLEAYDHDDKDRPALLDLLKLVEKANTALAGQNWVLWKKEYKDRSPLFREIIDLFRREESRLHFHCSKDKPFLSLIDEPDQLQNWTPFHWATHTGRLEQMKTLLSRMANPFLITGTNRNALHQAAEATRLEVMEFVFSIPIHPTQGWFNIDFQDEYGGTPLHVAVYGKSADSVRCVEMLLSRGARRDLPREGDLAVPLHLASWAKEDVKENIVDLLSADRGSHVNALDRRGRTPIFNLLDDSQCVGMLLSRGADLSIRDNDLMTVLHVTCIANRLDTLKTLLLYSPPSLKTLQDKDGHSPLAKAIECGSAACAIHLLEVGAIGHLHRKDGLTLVHRAIEMGDEDFLKACFEHPTFQKGTRKPDKMTVMEFAGRKARFSGRIADLILEYESYAPRVVTQEIILLEREAELAKEEARAAFFALR
jgi:ankyrin repeat protein